MSASRRIISPAELTSTKCVNILVYVTRFTLNDRARLAAFLVVSSAEGEGAYSDRPRHRSWIGRRFWWRHGIAGVGRVEGVDGGCEACGKRATGSSHWMSFTLQAPTYLRRLHAGRYRLRPPRLTALTLEPQHRWRQSSANGDTPALAASVPCARSLDTLNALIDGTATRVYVYSRLSRLKQA